jgi:hypothetical protein
MGTIQGLYLYANGAEEMIYEVQTYDATDKTVYYETVEDAIDYEDARDVIAEKYPNRKVLAVIGRKTLDELAQEHSPDAP